MNVSGKSVGTAWRAWEKSRGKGGVLVVIHDELEKELGKVSFRRGGSARWVFHASRRKGLNSANGKKGVITVSRAFRPPYRIRHGCG